jgi:Arc/MetJ-type ribon-helix-helix transcriptional regulator
MPTRNIVLTQHQSSFAEHLVASGKYQNASEVLREGPRLMEQQEKESLCGWKCFARQSTWESTMSRADDSLNSEIRNLCGITLSA